MEEVSQEISDALLADKQYLQNKIKTLGTTEWQQEERKRAEEKLLEINKSLRKQTPQQDQAKLPLSRTF